MKKQQNQCSLEWTEQHTQVGTVSRHMLRDVCEDGTKEGGGHNVRIKERHRERIANRWMRGGHAQRATCFVRDGE